MFQKKDLLNQAKKEQKKDTKKEVKIYPLFKKIARKRPQIKIDLIHAGRKEDPAYFVQKSFMTSLYMSLGLILILFVLLAKTEFNKIYLLFIFPILLWMMFNYFLKAPSVYAKKYAHQIDREIVDVIRFLTVEINSGVPIYQAFVNISSNFETIGKISEDIVEKVELGQELESAINETINNTPSEYLRRVLFQVINSLKTGADLTIPLNSVLNQTVKEQKILLKTYARKLNPMSMFYMMMAVIVPTLGVTMLTVLATFINIQLSLLTLIGIALFFTFIQFMFLNAIKSSRPPIDF